MNFEAVQLTRAARGIGLAARALLLNLSIYADADGAAYVSAQRLADDLETDVRRVRRILAELVQQGILMVIEKGNGRGCATTYRFTVNSGTGATVSGEKGGAGATVFSGKGGTGTTVSREKGGMGATVSREKGGAGATLSNSETVAPGIKNSGTGTPKTVAPVPPQVNISKRSKLRRAPAREGATNPTDQTSDQGEAAGRWRAVLELIRLRLTPEEFETWLAGIGCARLDAGGVVLVAPSDFFRRWILHNYAGQIGAAAAAVLGLGGDAAPELDVVVGDDQGAEGGEIPH